MKQIKILWAIIALLSLTLVSCEPDEQEVPAQPKECSFTIKTPIGINNASYKDINVTIKSNLDGKEVTLTPETPTFKWLLLEGTYQLSLTATLSYKSDKFGNTETTISHTDILTVSKDKVTFEITPQYIENVQSGFVIEEIFFSPSVDPNNPSKTYQYKEQYIKITNNSDVLLYADSLAIAQGAELCNMKKDYKAEYLPLPFLVDFLAMIPGDGKTYPVKPGESLIIANNAEDHSKVFPGAVDLSHADFEIYDLSSNPHFQDTDNLNVPNLIPYYTYSRTVTSFHQRGCKPVALVRMHVDPETYAKDYYWEGVYVFRFNDFVKDMPSKAMKVPYEWVGDVVFLGIDGMVDWRCGVPDEFDSGYTGWRQSFDDKTGQGTAVRRKIERVGANGRRYLKDTNNSTVDFEKRVVPSLKQAKE